MRVLLAIALGAIVAAIATWWFARDPAPATEALQSPDTAAPALYRWRDAAGVLQITDRPPEGRPYEIVDSSALERRNVFDPVPAGGNDSD